jgi:uncharacterized protein (TIGR02266 family)
MARRRARERKIDVSNITMPIPSEGLREALGNEAARGEYLSPHDVLLDEEEEEPGSQPDSPPREGAVSEVLDRDRPSVRTRPVRELRRLPFEVSVDLVSEHNFFTGLTRNISEGGLFVATHLPFELGARLEVRLLLPGDAEPTALLTEVCWLRAHSSLNESLAGVGLRFVDPPEPIVARIHEFMSARDPLYVEL